MESLRQPDRTTSEEYDYEDYRDSSFFNLLEKLPRELALLHISHIESEGLDDLQTTEYLEGILKEREKVTTETFISDQHLKEMISENEIDFYKQLETSILSRSDNFLGYGTTSDIKRYDIQKDEEVLSMAIKYLLTPTKKTLSASAEHDMLLEVERMKEIEEIESDHEFEYISVPHPYLHHKTSRIQCYGMQAINGSNLDFALVQAKEGSLSEAFIENLKKVDTNKLVEEIDIFFNKMHTYCLHGDIKPKNIMFDENGKFYIIDFGQSVLTYDIDEKSRDQFENLKESEIQIAKEVVRSFIRKMSELIA